MRDVSHCHITKSIQFNALADTTWPAVNPVLLPPTSAVWHVCALCDNAIVVTKIKDNSMEMALEGRVVFDLESTDLQ